MLFDLWIINERWHMNELVEMPTCKTDVFFEEDELKTAIDEIVKGANKKAQSVATLHPDLVTDIECVKESSAWTIYAKWVCS